MPDYRAQAQEATSWRRAYAITIQNPLEGEGSPQIAFHEQDAIRIGSRIVTTIAADAGPAGLVIAFDPTKSIPLLDPSTGAEVGQISHGQIYAALHSAYMAAALERDAREQAAQEEQARRLREQAEAKEAEAQRLADAAAAAAEAAAKARQEAGAGD